MAAGEVDIWFETFGNPVDRAVLLVMGQGGQATAWDTEFCDVLVSAGFHVIRFDNRDVGFSGTGEHSEYTISDMALDAIAVLDEVNVQGAHIVGQSMGGMVAQQMAIDSPDRVASLALLSTTPDIAIQRPDAAVTALVSDLSAAGETDWTEVAVQSARLQTGSRWQFDEVLIRDRIDAAVERAFRPDGATRQLEAILRSPARTTALAVVGVPTLVVHGTEDPILPIKHAHALADAIPEAALHVIDGMGHVIPWGHWDDILRPLLSHLSPVDTRR